MVAIGMAIGSPARAAMLDALFEGHALTATELARLARVSPPTASAHLEKLLRSGLVVRERHGRHRYFRIAGPEVAEALEVLARLGVERTAPRPPPSRERKSIRRARLCYDHFAGALGVAMTSAMVDHGWLVPEDRDFRLTESGEAFFAGLGIDLDAARSKRRMFARQCLDWSERQAASRGLPRGRPRGAGLRRRLGEANEATPRGRHHAARRSRARAPLRAHAPAFVELSNSRTTKLRSDRAGHNRRTLEGGIPHILEGAVEDAMTERHAFCTS